jgi:predicted Zn-ribbon and HTH transcriptional regulator
MTVVELSAELREAPRDVAEDLKHLLKSLEHSDYVAIVTSARCRKCAFTFDDAKLRKPGRCPSCRGTWIEPARIGLRTRARARKRSKG